MRRNPGFGLLLCCSLVLPRSVDAQVLAPFLSGFAQRAPDKPVAAREPWYPAQHAAAIASAIEAAAALPERSITRMQVRLAALLAQTGDRAVEARLLRQAVDTLHEPGASLNELARRLVEVGELDSARKLASEISDPTESQQVLSGMLEGAIKAGNLDAGLDALLLAQSLPRNPNFDPFAFQAKTLAVALAKAGRYRQALAAFPTSGPTFGPDLPRIATQACAADPSLADQAAKAVAVAALKLASAKFAANAPVEEVQAFAACKGEAAARQLVATMPADIANNISVTPSATPSFGDPGQIAADAFKASRDADEAKADLLFAAAKAKLDAAAAGRGASREARQRFDTSASQVALWMTQAKRPEAALALVTSLPSLERLPILFTLAQTAAKGFVDPTVFIAAIDDAFGSEAALVQIEANDIRALRRALPLGSPAYPKIEGWLRMLPVEKSAPADRRSLPFKPADQITPLLRALEKAAPSVAVARRVLLEAGGGQVTQALGEAKALLLTPRETGLVEMIRDFVAALPETLITSYDAFEIYGVIPKQGLTALPVDSLVLSIERIALNANNLSGAREAFATIDAGSPLKSSAAALLAIGEARLGLPREALESMARIEDPAASFAILSAVVAVRPST